MARKRTTKPAGAASAATKTQVETTVQAWIDTELKPRMVRPPEKEPQYNYITDIIQQWHGSVLFLVAIYTCPHPDTPEPTFEERFARLRPGTAGRFDLSFMRHTGQWVELYQGQTLQECLLSIRDEPFFEM